MLEAQGKCSIYMVMDGFCSNTIRNNTIAETRQHERYRLRGNFLIRIGSLAHLCMQAINGTQRIPLGFPSQLYGSP